MLRSSFPLPASFDLILDGFGGIPPKNMCFGPNFLKKLIFDAARQYFSLLRPFFGFSFF